MSRNRQAGGAWTGCASAPTGGQPPPAASAATRSLEKIAPGRLVAEGKEGRPEGSGEWGPRGRSSGCLAAGLLCQTALPPQAYSPPGLPLATARGAAYVASCHADDRCHFVSNSSALPFAPIPSRPPLNLARRTAGLQGHRQMLIATRRCGDVALGQHGADPMPRRGLMRSATVWACPWFP
jgi:hypothetical protein